LDSTSTKSLKEPLFFLNHWSLGGLASWYISRLQNKP
jgi:hypothetical protein